MKTFKEQFGFPVRPVIIELLSTDIQPHSLKDVHSYLSYVMERGVFKGQDFKELLGEATARGLTELIIKDDTPLTVRQIHSFLVNELFRYDFIELCLETTVEEFEKFVGATVADVRDALDYLINHEPENSVYGICFNLKRRQGIQGAYQFVSRFSVGWEEHSGSMAYPVQGVQGTNMWEGANLMKRRRLCKFLLARINDMVWRWEYGGSPDHRSEIFQISRHIRPLAVNYVNLNDLDLDTP